MIYKDKMTSKLGLLGDRKEAAGRAALQHQVAL